MTYTLGEIAKHIDADLHGDPECQIKNVATLNTAKAGAISFLANRRYTKQLITTKASAVILSPVNIKSNPVFSLVMEDPYLGFARVVNLLYPQAKPQPGIHPKSEIDSTAFIDTTAFIGPNVVIGENTRIEANVEIGPGCVIGSEVTIGTDSKLIANVVLVSGAEIGARVILHPGVIIGSDGFGLANNNGQWLKIPQIGSVKIGNDVEIGTNSSIDRGSLEDTIIEDGVKIDNQVQIGHNVRVGAHTAIAGCTGIAGSTTIGERCMIGGAVGISGHIEITNDVIITAMSGVANSIKEPGVYSSGFPAMDARAWRKNVASLKHLYKFNSRLNKLEKKS
jgi:UDP-3-O-[3-hydroxymyristoyl] glucosamine N-acyltransferase